MKWTLGVSGPLPFGGVLREDKTQTSNGVIAVAEKFSDKQTQLDLDAFPTDATPIITRLSYIVVAVIVLGLLSYFDVLRPYFGDDSVGPDEGIESSGGGEVAPTRDLSAPFPGISGSTE